MHLPCLLSHLRFTYRIMVPEFEIPIWLLISLATFFLAIRLLCHTSIFQMSRRGLCSILDKIHIYNLYKVPQYNDHSQENNLYRKISTYIKSLPSLEDSNFAALYSGDKPGDILVSLGSDQSVTDTFLHATVTWTYRKLDYDHGGELVLKIKSKDKKKILAPYIQHIYKVVDEIEQRKKDLKVYLNSASGNDSGLRTKWKSFPFVHPSSFDTIVLNNDVKNKVKCDLELFLKSKQYYNKIGRVWRRSYLLYGGSGTGKSSFAAAMTKFLAYDLYDIDLSKASDSSDLKTLLLQTTRKSLILVENLDLFLMGKSTSVSLSAVLNFMDGVVSNCGEEQVMVFTMNCKTHIDPLVLRPGRVDVHIHFPFCDFNGFKALALSHLGIKDHKLFGQVEELLQGSPRLSQAEISEIMISNRTSATRAIKSIIMTLQNDSDDKSGKFGQELLTSGDRVSDEPDDSGPKHKRQGSGTMREIQKLYGLIRLRNSRREEPLDLSSN